MPVISDYHEKLFNTIISSNLALLIEHIGITFKVDRPQADPLYDEVLGSLGREYTYLRIKPDGKGIMNMSEFQWLPYSPEDVGRFDIGYLYTFNNIQVSDKITILRNDILAESYRVMDKETYGVLNRVVNRFLVKPF